MTGCNRGLGLEFVRQLLSGNLFPPPPLVMATCRNPDSGAQELTQTAILNRGKLVVERLDLSDLASIPKFVEKTKVRQQTLL